MEVHRPKFIKGFIEEVIIILVSISLAVTAERMVEHYVHNKEGKEALVRLAAEMKRDTEDFLFNVNIHKNALDFTFFASNTSEYESLKATSKLSYIENHELLSKIIVNYNRYEDFKLGTTIGTDIVQKLFAIIRPRVKYKFNTVNHQPHYLFDGASIKNNLKGNQEFLNLLQEKKLNDTQALLWNQRGFDRTVELIHEIKEEIK